MAHNRKLVVGATALTMAMFKVDNRGLYLDEVRNELEAEVIASGYLEGAPFNWVDLSIREGLVDDDKPRCFKPNKKWGDLPLAIEIDVRRIVDQPSEVLKQVYRKATLIALAFAGRKYNLNTNRIDELLAQMNQAEGA